MTRPLAVSKYKSSILSVRPPPRTRQHGERSTKVAERFDSTCELAALTNKAHEQTVKQVWIF
jgi:hypothetical protein